MCINLCMFQNIHKGHKVENYFILYVLHTNIVISTETFRQIFGCSNEQVTINTLINYIETSFPSSLHNTDSQPYSQFTYSLSVFQDFPQSHHPFDLYCKICFSTVSLVILSNGSVHVHVVKSYLNQNWFFLAWFLHRFAILTFHSNLFSHLHLLTSITWTHTHWV
jgi:hypothetical protein